MAGFGPRIKLTATAQRSGEIEEQDTWPDNIAKNRSQNSPADKQVSNLNYGKEGPRK
jgi:hypothetical protein